MTKVDAIRVNIKSAISLTILTTIGIAAFFWPFLAAPGSAVLGHSTDAPLLFALLLPLILAVALAQIAEQGIDARSIAILGILIALAAALRPIGAGTAGLEPMWVILVVGGRVLGRGFGFVLGTLALLVSAVITRGIGPWLPFQMIAAGWIGFGAACLPAIRGKKEVVLLAIYGAGASLVYGCLLNLWFWPWTTGLSPGISFVAGLNVLENVKHWLLFCLATSLGFDIPRMILTAGLVLVAGVPVLRSLRHAVRAAAFDEPVDFIVDVSQPHPGPSAGLTSHGAGRKVP